MAVPAGHGRPLESGAAGADAQHPSAAAGGGLSLEFSWFQSITAMDE
jgi:hypothetical protein